MKYSQKLLEIRKKFDGTQYDSLITEYMLAYVHDNKTRMDEIIKQLPTDIQLLENLVNKLKGKSVYTNLKKILNEEKISNIDREITLSSLYTHICIEMKQGNLEYKNLKQGTFQKLGFLNKRGNN